MNKQFIIKTVHGYLVSFRMDGYNIYGEEYSQNKSSAYKFKNVLLLNRVKRALEIEEPEVEQI